MEEFYEPYKYILHGIYGVFPEKSLNACNLEKNEVHSDLLSFIGQR